MGRRKFRRILKAIKQNFDVESSIIKILITFILILFVIVLFTSEEERFISNMFVYYIIVIFIIFIVVMQTSLKLQAEEFMVIKFRNLPTNKKIRKIIDQNIIEDKSRFDPNRLKGLRSSYLVQPKYK